VGLGAGHGWIALDIRYDQIELGAAQGFNAASIIDHLHRQFRRVDAALADLRKTAGDWVKSTDVYGVGGRRGATVKCANRALGERARGLNKKVAPAKSLRIKIIFGSFHLNLPEISALSLQAPTVLASWRLNTSWRFSTSRDLRTIGRS